MTSSAFFQGLDLFHSFFEEIECSLECHALLRSSRKEKRKVSAKQRLTFPFPFVHHQPHDWKVEQLLTVERRTLKRRISSTVGCSSLSKSMLVDGNCPLPSLLFLKRKRREREEEDSYNQHEPILLFLLFLFKKEDEGRIDAQLVTKEKTIRIKKSCPPVGSSKIS